MTTEQTGAPTDLVGGMPATRGAGVENLDPAEQETLAAIAGHLIPAAHGMPSAAEIVTDERLDFVLTSRPDLARPLRAALRADLGTDVSTRLAKLAGEETNLAALQLVIVAGYYSDARVRELIGYPGQLALDFDARQAPQYIAEGLIDQVIARGPVWRDPATGRRAQMEDRDGRAGA